MLFPLTCLSFLVPSPGLAARGVGGGRRGLSNGGIILICLLRKRVASAKGDGIQRMPARRLFVSGAV